MKEKSHQKPKDQNKRSEKKTREAKKRQVKTSKEKKKRREEKRRDKIQVHTGSMNRTSCRACFGVTARQKIVQRKYRMATP
jgi:hypothetical protein